MLTDTEDELLSRLEGIQEIALDEKKSEIEDLIDSGEFEDAESMIDELESERS